MVKLRNLLKQVKERVEQELAAQNENQQQPFPGSLIGSQNYNAQQQPSLFGALSSAIERSIPSVPTLSSSLERSTLSDNSPSYVTIFCDYCLMIKKNGRYWFHTTLSALESSVEDGCHFCSLLTQGLYGLLPEAKGQNLALNLWSKSGFLEMKVMRRGNRGDLGDDWAIIEFMSAAHAPFPLEELSIWGPDPNNTITPGDTSSEASFESALGWIQICDQQHKSCNRRTIPPLPTRILDATAWPIIKLHEGRNQKAQYIALSHSWGGHHPIVTTQSTLQNHKKGIHFNELPKTFQDAILIIRRIGHRYIWIDSLCIIQDDKADWEREAAKMADVYQNAWLTISATCSSSPSNGCYNSEQKQTIEMRGIIRNSPFVLYARKQMEHVTSSWGPDSGRKPKRIYPLHCSRGELFWECREMVKCECNGIQGFDKNANVVSYSGAPPKIEHNRFANSAATKDQLHSRWRSMVVEYTQRQLTVGTDRLPAFAGVAAEMQGYLGERYLAGLWEDSFVTDLCWKKDSGIHVTPRVRKIRGSSWPGTPSWSWAVVNCNIEYDRDLTEPNPKKRTVTKRVSCCEVLEVQWSPTSPEAYVILEAWLMPGRLCVRDNKGFGRKASVFLDDFIKSGSTEHERPDYRPTTYVCVDGSIENAATFESDFPLCDQGEWYIQGGEQIHCAKISRDGEWEDSVPQWLVLKCIDADTHVYERIGLTISSNTRWPCTESRKRIRIV